MPATKTTATAPYAVSIIRAGALLPDTRLLLAHWDLSADVETNLHRITEENRFAKSSRARVAEVLSVFRQRYLADPDVLAGLVSLAQDDAPADLLNPILYFQTARADAMLRDVVLEVLAPIRARGQSEVRPEDVDRWLRQQVAAGKTRGAWQPSTTHRLACGILSALRDFGLLQGKATKRLAPVYLPPAAFAFIAFQLSRTQRSGEKLLHDPAWQLFFLAQPAVEHLFFEAHQERLLEYHAAGRVIRVEFSAATLQEYAHALAR